MRKPIFSDAEITETGERLEKQTGQKVSAWHIFKELGERGKLSRIDSVWEDHCNTRTTAKLGQDIELPEDVDQSFDEALAGFKSDVGKILKGMIDRQTEQQHRRLAFLERDMHLADVEHDREKRALMNEIENLTELLEERERELEALEHEIQVSKPEALSSEPAQPESSTPAPVAEVLAAARKAPNRPLRNTPPAPRKTARPTAPSRKKSPSPKPTSF